MSEFNRRKQSFSIPNLPLYLIIAYVIGYVIQLTTPELYQFLQFNTRFFRDRYGEWLHGF